MLERTSLTDFQKVHLAAAAVAHQGESGAISELADEYGVSRSNTVYAVMDNTQGILEQQVLQDTTGQSGFPSINSR